MQISILYHDHPNKILKLEISNYNAFTLAKEDLRKKIFTLLETLLLKQYPELQFSIFDFKINSYFDKVNQCICELHYF